MFCYLTRIFARLDRIEREVRRVRFIVSRPAQIRVVCFMEIGEMISFAVVLPVPPAVASDWGEVEKGELTVTIGVNDPVVLETDKAVQLTADRQVTDPRFQGLQGTVVEAKFVYIDDAGNRGAVTMAMAELADTVPPVAPGVLGIVATGETPDDGATPIL